MQLKARHRREVVEEILDIQIFSIMNLLARQKTKELTEEIREVDYNYDITTEKIELQENYIEDIKKNKDDIIVEKTNLLTSNEEEISDRKTEQKNLTETNEKLLSSIIDEDKAISKRDKLKDFRFSLKDKHSRESALITFFEENDECPTC